MNVDPRWLWAGGILAIAGGALVLGVPLATVITIAAVLACPAAMYFGMGMMGRTHGGAEMGGGTRVLDGRDAATTGASAPLPSASRPAADPSLASERAAASDHEDPIVILKRRLAAGEIALAEYERLLAVISRPAPGRDEFPTGQGASR